MGVGIGREGCKRAVTMLMMGKALVARGRLLHVTHLGQPFVFAGRISLGNGSLACRQQHVRQELELEVYVLCLGAAKIDV
jgi:hypothetical protein